MRNRVLSTALASALFLALTAATAPAAVITVDAGGGGDHLTIAAAVGAAIDGDTIDILSNITENNITISNKDLVIRGQGADVTTVQAAAARGTAGQRIFTLTGSATIAFQDLTLKHGDTTGQGGAIGISRWNNIHLTVERCALVDNDAATDGGGIFHGNASANQGDMTIIDSTFSGNVAADGHGAALRPEAIDSAIIRNSTFSNNTASHSAAWEYGGAVSMTPRLGLVQNSTFVGNTLQGGVLDPLTTKQGGSAIGANDFTTVESCVFADNVGLGRGVIAGWSGTPDVKNILAEGAFVTWTTDLGGNTENAPDAGVDPNLADNGGTTLTHALLAGSGAIDTGSNPASLVNDQRGAGFLRTVGAGTDMGAYEYVPEPAAMGLLGLGSAGIALMRRRRRRV